MSAKQGKAKKVSPPKSAAPQGWPADQIERRPIGALNPYENNPRTHSDEQIAQIVASIREFGWTMPVLVDEDGGIIAGHGRVMAASKLGIGDIPVMVAHGWSEAQKRAYVIADNKLTLNGGWDDELLRAELTSLQDAGFDLELTGFSQDEIDDIFGAGDVEDGMFGTQNTPEVTGTMFQFGEFRLRVDQTDYNAWLDKIRNEVGFEQDAILTELKRRLRLP